MKNRRTNQTLGQKAASRNKKRTKMRKRWLDFRFRIKQKKARQQKQNKLEKHFEEILLKSGHKFNFVGDRKLIIGGKNPDFWDGKNNLIEVFGDYWHRNEKPQERIDFYKDMGFNCLVIWEHEIKRNTLSVIYKINEFVKNNDAK